MEQLLNHLLVPKDGQLVPAASESGDASQNPPSIPENTHAYTNTSSGTAHRTNRPSDINKFSETSKKRKMDQMDFAPPSGQPVAHMEPSPFANVSGGFMIGGPDLQSVEDFDRENPWEPKPKLVAIAAPKVNMQNKIALHDICQKLGMVIELDVRETAPQCFAGSIKIGQAVRIEDKGPFRSKKEAGEALATAALPLMQRFQLDNQQYENKAVAARKSIAEHLTRENWVGSLQNYVQAHVRGYVVPDYTDYEIKGNKPQFACTVTFPGAPGTPFGSTTEFWPSKAEAKKAAAREAVLWLRSQGAVIPATQVLPNPPSKKRKHTEIPPQVVEADGNSTGLTQALTDVDVNAVTSDSLPQRVHSMVTFLGFSQPTWDTKPSLPPPGTLARDQSLGGFVDMACVFVAKDVEREPRLAGCIGEVKNVYGRKKAKEMCCLEVLRVLEGIKQSR
ncbi:hypothetical protein EJ03DRAFT_330773 [Teratosphaeria nubilosa]|uniref:DRBM domain-containing protein n=1 Tax=Teratosphaeria nubilosa TaxID=161662 RepID=A0A6G1L0D2_9PEZI|nr:hypothetical protein EJ03DRAFT_330773 [Teratosphaeria nubilosa]